MFQKDMKKLECVTIFKNNKAMIKQINTGKPNTATSMFFNGQIIEVNKESLIDQEPIERQESYTHTFKVKCDNFTEEEKVEYSKKLIKSMEVIDSAGMMIVSSEEVIQAENE